MIIHLNNNLSSKNTLNKTLSVSKQFNVRLKEKTDLLYPQILITGILTDFHNFNYAYIPGFKRYYFITDIVSVSSQLVQISLAVDVLMTYRDEIKKCKCLVDRQEKKYNSFYYDDQFPEFVYSNTIVKKFPKSFSSQPSYILAIRG